MAKTAVGLFENSGLADEVVRDLEATGFPGKDVRVLGEPREMAGSGLMSTPRTDFEVDLIRDLAAFGVLEADAESYVQGVRRGGVMVFATSSSEKADAAAEIMNRHGAVEIEEISASRPELPNSGPRYFYPNWEVSLPRLRRPLVRLVALQRKTSAPSRNSRG
jgi:hypothetical protein